MNNKSIFPGQDLQDVSISELLKNLGTHSTILLREEVTLIKQEIRERLQALRGGAIMLGIGVVMGVVAFATLWAAFIIWLTAYLPPDLAAAATGGGLALLALLFALIGVKLMKKSTGTPIKTVEALEGRTENG